MPVQPFLQPLELGVRARTVMRDAHHINAVKITARPFWHRGFVAAIVLQKFSRQLIDLLMLPADKHRCIGIFGLLKGLLQFADFVIAKPCIDRHSKMDSSWLDGREWTDIGVRRAAIRLLLRGVRCKNRIRFAKFLCNDARQFQGTVKPAAIELSQSALRLFSMADEDDRLCRRL